MTSASFDFCGDPAVEIQFNYQKVAQGWVKKSVS